MGRSLRPPDVVVRELNRAVTSPLAIALLYIALVLLFALAYRHAGTFLLQDQPGDRLETYVEAFYFSAVTITTLGYGDIAPADRLTRLLAAIQALTGMVLIGLFLNAFALRISERSRRETEQQLERVRAHAMFELHRLTHDLAREMWCHGPDRLAAVRVWHGDHHLETWSPDDVLDDASWPSLRTAADDGDRLGALARQLGEVGRDFVALLDADLRDALALLTSQLERRRRLEQLGDEEDRALHQAGTALRSALLHFNRLLLRRATQVEHHDAAAGESA